MSDGKMYRFKEEAAPGRDCWPAPLPAYVASPVGLVLWHDCQIDYLANKKHKKADDVAKAVVAVAPIRP